MYAFYRTPAISSRLVRVAISYAHTQIIKTKLIPKLAIQVNARILFDVNLLALLAE